MKQLELSAPRSAELVINSLIERGLLQRRDNTKLQLVEDTYSNNESANTVNLPLVGRVAAGVPILAEQNVEAYIPVDEKLLRGDPNEYYLLRVHGNSMNLRNIHDGDLAIVKRQQAAEPGQNVVALINDEATVKELVSAQDMVILKPHSTDKSIQPIILQEDFMVQGIVIGTIPTGHL
jgi:repressor LexA